MLTPVIILRAHYSSLHRQSNPVSSNAVLLWGRFAVMSLIPAKRQGFEFSELLTEIQLSPSEKIYRILKRALYL